MQFKSGNVVSTLLLAILASVPCVALAAPDLSGVWILYRAEDFGEPHLTAAGEQFRENYDFGKDDPALSCIPASWTRVFSNPNTPFEIQQYDTKITLRHELFDIAREVPLIGDFDGVQHVPGNPALPTLGSSVAWYDGAALLVHTTDYGDEPRVLSTIRGWAGLPQSPLLITLERYEVIDGKLSLKITHFDPAMYTEPLIVRYLFDAEPDFSVEVYGCEPEAAEVLTIDPDNGVD